jgi:hypothetical protein
VTRALVALLTAHNQIAGPGNPEHGPQKQPGGRIRRHSIPNNRRTHLTYAADVMAIRRTTISMPETLAEQIKKAAGDRPAWRWVQEVLEERLTDEELNRQWEQFYTDVSPGPEAIKQADEMFERLTMPTTP